jgi:hypothetical protein
MELSAKARAANSSDLKPFFLNLATVVLARNVTTALSMALTAIHFDCGECRVRHWDSRGNVRKTLAELVGRARPHLSGTRDWVVVAGAGSGGDFG